MHCPVQVKLPGILVYCAYYYSVEDTWHCPALSQYRKWTQEFDEGRIPDGLAKMVEEMSAEAQILQAD